VSAILYAGARIFKPRGQGYTAPNEGVIEIDVMKQVPPSCDLNPDRPPVYTTAAGRRHLLHDINPSDTLMPYVGMGKVFDFMHTTNDVLSERGVALPLPGQSTTTPETREEKGLAVQKQIVGDDVVEKLYASAPPDQQHIQRLLSANCFGDHLTRSGIDVPTRELLTFTMLVSLGGCDPQVRGHVAANLHVGNSRKCSAGIWNSLFNTLKGKRRRP